MIPQGILSLSPLISIFGVIVLAVLAFGLIRFFVHLAWRLIGLVLTLAIIIGIVLFFMHGIHINW